MSKLYSRLKPSKPLVWTLVLFLFILPWQACGPTFLPVDGMGFDALSRRPGSGGNGNGDVYTGMRSLKTLARSGYHPSIPLAPGPDDHYLRFVKGAQCSANPQGPEHSGSLRFLSGEWRLQANACTATDRAVTGVESLSYARDVVSWNDQVFGFSERRDDLFTSAYPLLWCRSNSTSGEGLSLVVGEKIIDATPAGDGALSLQFPSDDPNLPAGVSFSRDDSSGVATFVGSDQLIKRSAPGARRIDYDPGSGDVLGLLLEEERTNLALNSAALETWTRSADVIAGVDAATSPDGSRTAESFATASGSGSLVHKLPTVSSKTSYTFSIYARREESSPVVTVRYENATTLAEAQFDLADVLVRSNGSAKARISRAYGSWSRLQLTFDHMPGPSAQIAIVVDKRPASPLVVWGGQLEAGEFATSYVPTETVPVTRRADVLTATRLDFFRSGVGALLVKFLPLPGQQSGTAFELGDKSGRRLGGDVDSNRLFLNTRGTAAPSSSALGSVLGYRDLRVAFAVANQNSTAAVSGALRAYEAPLSIGPTSYTEMSFGRKLDGTNPLSGHIRRVTQWSHELAFGTLVHESGMGTPLPLQGQISLGRTTTSGLYERGQVFNFQVDRLYTNDVDLRFHAPDYDFDLKITRSPTSIRKGTASIEAAIDDKLYREELTCTLEPDNFK